MPAQSKASKTLLPHHSVPRLGSACPESDIDSGQRGLTERPDQKPKRGGLTADLLLLVPAAHLPQWTNA